MLISISRLNEVRALHGWRNTATEAEKNQGEVEVTMHEGAGGLLLLAAANETGLLTELETAIISISQAEASSGKENQNAQACKQTCLSSPAEHDHSSQSHSRETPSLLSALLASTDADTLIPQSCWIAENS